MVMGKILSGYVPVEVNRMGAIENWDDPKYNDTGKSKGLSILDSIVGAISVIGDTAMKVATPIITSKTNLKIANMQKEMSDVDNQLLQASDQYNIDRLNIKKAGLAEAMATMGLTQTATGSNGGLTLTPLGVVAIVGITAFAVNKLSANKKK